MNFVERGYRTFGISACTPLLAMIAAQKFSGPLRDSNSVTETATAESVVQLRLDRIKPKTSLRKIKSEKIPLFFLEEK
jgi:hypothetical protein